MISNAEKLEVVEFMIEQLRDSRNEFASRSREHYLVLKEIADDLRAPAKSSDTIERMERAIRNAHDRKTSTGYATGNLREIAELTIGRWPTIKQALEKIE